MNEWLQQSIEYANQRSYLDNLFRVYPTIPDGIREIDENKWNTVQVAFDNRDNTALIKALLKLKLFPVKDSYIAYLRRDKSAIDRNPATVDRICGMLYRMGLNQLYERVSVPKEANRQIGPMFNNWIRNKSLGITPIELKGFKSNNNNAILNAPDATMLDFIKTELDYKGNKRPDFVGRFNGKYVIGEAKFLTDFGGHQNAQFNDAIAFIKGANTTKAVVIAILDGVLYIKGKLGMHKTLTETYSDYPIMSALVLPEFLYQL